MWPCRGDVMTRKSTRTTKASLANVSLATCPTDPRQNRAVNPYPQRARSNRHPHEAKHMNTLRQKVRASADSFVRDPRGRKRGATMSRVYGQYKSARRYGVPKNRFALGSREA